MRFYVAQASVSRQSVFSTVGGVKLGALVLGAIAAVSLSSTAPVASAHQTQISDGVGGTHHIEPNDTPKAGEPSQTWFALTQAGGAAIGFSDCDCELQLLGSGGDVIAAPALTAIAVEGLTDVPAAELTFPQVGAYVLTLTGSPKGTADFPSFRLDFPVTVAAGKALVGQAAPKAAEALGSKATDDEVIQGQDTAQAKEQGEVVNPSLRLLPIGLLVVIAIAFALAWQVKQR